MFDVIGDVHGQGELLVALLQELGYSEHGGAYGHPDRQAVFVGDLIDRGPEQLLTLRTVRSMVDAGTAMITLGNHEFNAIAWATTSPTTGKPCRSHDDKNRWVHAAFLDAVGDGTAEHDRWIDWFTTLPLWLDFGGLRVVHACWDGVAVRNAGRELPTPSNPAGGVGPAVSRPSVAEAAESSTRSRWTDRVTISDSIEWLIKGPEVDLPDGLSYADHAGKERRSVRFAWWDPDATTLRRGAVVPPDAKTLDGLPFPDLPDNPIAGELPIYRDTTPVIFGHYWCDDDFDVVRPNALCVDYSAGLGGPLAAYRWSGESALDADRLVMVGS